MKKHRSQSPASKLVLRKETVATLTRDQLELAVGAKRAAEDPGSLNASVCLGCST